MYKYQVATARIRDGHLSDSVLLIYFTKGGNVPRIILLGVYTKIQTRPVSSQGPSSHCKTFPVLHKGHEQKATAPTGLLQFPIRKEIKGLN